MSSSALSAKKVASNASDDLTGKLDVTFDFVNASALLRVQSGRAHLGFFEFGELLDNATASDLKLTEHHNG